MTLSQALEPLYRSYLRRLDEMAARLPEGAALLEATTRGDDGRLVPGNDGLPLRFDVADARTGETFEVRGAAPDAPGASELSMERLAIRLAAGNWEALPLVCAFDGEPLAEDAEALADLIRSWAYLAAYGGFARERPARGAAADLPVDGWQGKLHAVAIALHDSELRVLLDLGTCPPAALEALCGALAAFGDDRQPLAHVTIGGPAPA